MEFVKKETQSKPVGKSKIEVGFGHLLTYPVPINFYSVPPTGDLELEEAEHLVTERIRLLRVFEADVEGDSFLQTLENTKARLEAMKPAKLTDSFNFYVGSNRKTKDNFEYRRKDHISHFLLRLYCCRNEELKKWFIWHETKFLQFQLLLEDNLSGMSEFMQLNCIDYERLDDVQKCHELLVEDKLLWDQNRFTKLEALRKIIYKVPFEEALDMVRLRRVYLERGNAYILSSDMVSLICARFRMELSKALASMSRRLPILNEDDRLIPRIGSAYYDLVTKVDQMKKADEKLANRERIDPEMINDLAKESFPPCMRSIHDQLRKNHHLKHYGRLHYGLFLKSIGLTMQDALKFFREEFIQTIAPEKFAKEYSYNIRYNYGQEGKRVNLSAFGCKKIIEDNPPGSGDTHGCPFKHFDRANLEAMLRRYDADDQSVSEMVALVEKKDYTKACTKYFKCKHPNYVLRADAQEIYHPNQFYSESRRAHRGEINLPIEENGAGDEEGNQENGQNAQQNFEEMDFLDNVVDDLKDLTDAQLMDALKLEIKDETTQDDNSATQYHENVMMENVVNDKESS